LRGTNSQNQLLKKTHITESSIKTHLACLYGLYQWQSENLILIISSENSGFLFEERGRDVSCFMFHERERKRRERDEKVSYTWLKRNMIKSQLSIFTASSRIPH
jgi:hypothetical protein